MEDFSMRITGSLAHHATEQGAASAQTGPEFVRSCIRKELSRRGIDWRHAPSDAAQQEAPAAPPVTPAEPPPDPPRPRVVRRRPARVVTTDPAGPVEEPAGELPGQLTLPPVPPIDVRAAEIADLEKRMAPADGDDPFGE